MSPRAFRVFLPLFLVFYGAAGFLTHSTFGGREIFPVFSWALYTDASRREVQYAARLIEVDGHVLARALDLLETPAFHRSPDYWRDAGVLNEFGAALDDGDGVRVGDLRRLFEANVLLEERVRYEIVRRTYDPLVRRASGAFQETSLGVFIKDRRARGQR